MELTRQDMDLLIEAVECWEKKDVEGSVVGSLLGAMFCRTEEDKEHYKREQEKQKAERDRSSRTTKERSILLRSKLIAMRDSVDADRFLEASN